MSAVTSDIMSFSNIGYWCHPDELSGSYCPTPSGYIGEQVPSVGTSQRTHVRCRSFDRVPLDTVSVSRPCLSLVNWPHTSIQPFGKRIQWI